MVDSHQLGGQSRSASDSFLLYWSCVERRRHCRLTNPNPGTAAGTGETGSVVRRKLHNHHTSVAGFNTETGLRHQR